MNLNYARRSEDTEQIKVISWAKWQEHVYPALGLLYHCPNGGAEPVYLPKREGPEDTL